ncbi:MAG: cupin domain-containing protein [Rhodospirillaceae bacterium]|jgi:quercetin dioxygenase-like cupin family protein|nr:cupin domain-containing protein [Rhodospirillaceae bacterium]MBT5938760.1 cupin domain-containing protein [Rhodospirillaceae bacterium]MBT7268408.1 cupin domain-containing protein [Rhodospirillaceae bacterium]
MYGFKLQDEQEFNPAVHVENILGESDGGDVTVACWEPNQVSPDHCHPWATELYFCFEGGGVMKTPDGTMDVVPGAFVVHPPGEMHEYTNGSERTLLFRVRYGSDFAARLKEWPSNPAWQPNQDDLNYFK